MAAECVLLPLCRKEFKSEPFYSERRFIQGEIHSIDRVWAISEGKRHQGMGLSLFIGVGNFIGNFMSRGSILAIWGKGWGFPGIGPLPTF